MRNTILTGVSLVILACATLSSPTTILPSATPKPQSTREPTTSVPTPTITLDAPPTIAFSNYLNFTSINQWEVQNINKITDQLINRQTQSIKSIVVINNDELDEYIQKTHTDQLCLQC